MKFRPCIDIHNGKVKQIVGGSLQEDGDTHRQRSVRENFVSEHDARYYAAMYREDGLCGGHIVLLNPADSPFYEADIRQAECALREYPRGLQIGGGIRAENAEYFLNLGASHIIVTSYAFQNGEIRYDNLEKLKSAVGRESVVLDISCRKRGGGYYIVTDRWQKYTNVRIDPDTFRKLSDYCEEFLVHAVDVEGKCRGIEEELVVKLAEGGRLSGRAVTYAGGIADMDDVRKIGRLGEGRLDITVGSALDLFGGRLAYRELICI